MFFKKKEPKKASAAELYEIVKKWDRLVASGDKDGIDAFFKEHSQDLPEDRRKTYVIAEFEEVLEKMGMEFAYKWVQEKLPGFSEDANDEIRQKCYGGSIGWLHWKDTGKRSTY